MSNRLKRKARKVVKDEADRKFDQELGVLKRARDNRYANATEAYRKTVMDARNTLAGERKSAEDDYNKGRDELLKAIVDHPSAKQASPQVT